ncbi:MAG TPA: phosphoribosylaminoimidazolesuccinocarboxamide synthase [Thermoanaerobaculia bacterium]|nr:phosphoribosylaminoimidazolesuccinocarboxamide synthase [Thermoanaerobaculia bacterium]
MDSVLWQSELPGLPPPRRGKVRDVYDLGEALLIVASDRLSAYDHVLRPGIPGKGKILNQLSNFWFSRLASIVPNHLLATDPADFPAALAPHRDLLRGRSVLVRKARVVPFECVARGFLAGSGYREYRKTGTVCGIPLPPGLDRASQLPEPIFTPATKAEEGHDENVDFATVERAIGPDLASTLRDLTLALYREGAAHASQRDLILADTKFELGHALDTGELLLVDEVLTPDSSRYWDIEGWRPGQEPTSFDKQFVRNWLDESGWDKESPPPVLPEDVVRGTLDRYVEAFRRITGLDPEL